MKKFVEKNTPLILFFLFLIFYGSQISQYTYKADIVAFAARSANEIPILNYAYLDSQTIPSGNCLPNYHLGHTIILWFVYQIVPDYLAVTHLPAAFFSAVCGALAIMFTYLIWLQLGIKKKESLYITLSFGLIPIYWEHSTIGEIHTLQILFILLFIYTFLKDRLLLSTLTFLIANLISPLSGLAISFIFLKGINKSTAKNGFLIAFSALIIYVIIFLSVGADFLALLNPGNLHPSGRGILYRLSVLGIFVLINFSFFIFYLYKGIKLSLSRERKLILSIGIGIIPQLLLVIISSSFVIEYGSFQILLFWGMAFPLGYYLSTISLKSKYFIFSLIFSFSITLSLFLLPHRVVGKSLHEAGRWLDNNGQSEKSIVGTWNAGINLVESRNGSDIDNYNQYYFDVPYPSDFDLMKIGKKEALITYRKKNLIRQKLSEINIPGLSLKEYSPLTTIEYGRVEKIFENDFVRIYSWTK